jgi:alpha/beta superfamily hydrolase
MQAFFAELEGPKQLVVVPGANHLFNGQVEDLGEAVRHMIANAPRRDA